MSSIAIEGELSHIEDSISSPVLIISSKWLECVEWMDKEEALWILTLAQFQMLSL